jgi:hypothetical protein
MVALSGSDPVGVLIGAKRPSGTLIHRIAVHPDHVRQGHGRHLLDSLSSKLAILGPPRIVAEVPETFAAAAGLFNASEYAQETLLTDYVWNADDEAEVPRADGTFVIPVTVDDLDANGLLAENLPQTCWERSVETLRARKDDIAGFAVASDERIEAYVLHTNSGEVLALRSLIEDGGVRLAQLLSRLHAQGMSTFTFPRVHPEEISTQSLAMLGFRPSGRYLLYAVTARSA